MFSSEYKISMPLSGITTSWFERDKKKFAFLDYDVKKGLNWNMKFYSDEGKKDVIVEINEQKLSYLGGKKGYEFKDVKTGAVIGAWMPKKRFLNLFLRTPYTLVVNGQVLAASAGDGFFKLLIPGAIRKMLARKVVDKNDKVIASISVQSTLGCGVVKVKPTSGALSDDKMAKSVAAFAAICGLQDI